MHTLNDMIDPDSLLTTLEHGLNLGAAYVDARVIMRRMSYVSFEGCNLSSSDHSIECGVGIRVFTQNGRGYFSTDSLSREAVKRGIETALKIACLNQRGQKKPESHFKYSSAKKKEYWTDSEPCTDHMEVPQKIYDYLTSATVEPDPEARNVFLCLSLLTQQLFANSEGSLIDTEIPRTYVTYSSYRIKEGKMSSLITDSRGHTEPLKKVEHEIPQILETVNSRVNTVRTSKKVNLQKMRSDVVVDSSAAGIVLHEAIGHPLEADSLVEGKSPFISDEGRMIGPEDVTIIDDGTLKGLYGSYPVDADGAASQRTLLVEKGVLKTYLIDLESGLDLGLEPNGSGRVGGFSGVPLPRSSNIFMKEGDWTTEELIESSAGCIYVRTPSAAQISLDHTSFFLESHEVYSIEKESLSSVKGGIRMFCDVRSLLKKITGIGEKVEFSPNTCIKKGQVVPVSFGTPHLRLSDVLYLEAG